MRGYKCPTKVNCKDKTIVRLGINFLQNQDMQSEWMGKIDGATSYLPGSTISEKLPETKNFFYN